MKCNNNKKMKAIAVAIAMALIIVGAVAVIALNTTKLAQAENRTDAVTPSNKGNVVVTLGGETISEPIFKIYFWITQQEFERTAPNVWDKELNGKKPVDAAKEDTLKDIKLAIAAKQKLKELGIKLTDEETKTINDQTDAIITKNADLVKNLKLETKDMKEFVTQALWIQKATTKIGEGYTPTAEELEAQMSKIKAKYETVTVKHILIGNKDDSGQALPENKIKEKKKLAERVLKKALDGEEMKTLVKDYSEDPGSVGTGGEYTFAKGEMLPEFENAAFTGEVGKVYPKLIETSYGYHIMKIEKREKVDPNQIKKESEQAAKEIYAQNELLKLSEKLSIKTTDVYDKMTIIK